MKITFYSYLFKMQRYIKYIYDRIQVKKMRFSDISILLAGENIIYYNEPVII